MFTALQPQRVRNLILMATPIDFAGDEGLLNLWSREEYFDVDKLIDAFGNCPGELLQFVFQLMKPVQNFAEKQLTFCENLHDAAFLDNFVAVERWANDSIPVAGETFRQYVKALYQQNQLVQGTDVVSPACTGPTGGDHLPAVAVGRRKGSLGPAGFHVGSRAVCQFNGRPVDVDQCRTCRFSRQFQSASPPLAGGGELDRESFDGVITLAAIVD